MILLFIGRDRAVPSITNITFSVHNTRVVPPVTVRMAALLFCNLSLNFAATAGCISDSIAPESNNALYAGPPSSMPIKFRFSSINPVTYPCSLSILHLDPAYLPLALFSLFSEFSSIYHLSPHPHSLYNTPPCSLSRLYCLPLAFSFPILSLLSLAFSSLIHSLLPLALFFLFRSFLSSLSPLSLFPRVPSCSLS